MEQQTKSKIWKIRTIKDYTEAHNHILMGQILDYNEAYIRLHCRSYHFGKVVNSLRDVREGVLMVRMVPWHRVEIVNELASSFNYINVRVTTDKDGDVVLKDDTYTYSLVCRQDKRF